MGETWRIMATASPRAMHPAPVSLPGARESSESFFLHGGWRPRMRAPVGDLDHAAEVLKTVAHPLRLRILSMLRCREECVSALAARLGTKPTTVSQALSILRRLGLVAVTRRHRQARYRLDEGALRELIPCIERTLSLAPSTAGFNAAGRARRRPAPQARASARNPTTRP
jgi:DNA-binding transcriptional ArsR family regulator